MAEKSQRELMIERLVYFAIMALLAKWGGITTDVAIQQTERLEVKREQVDHERELRRQAIITLLMDMEEMEEAGCTVP